MRKSHSLDTGALRDTLEYRYSSAFTYTHQNIYREEETTERTQHAHRIRGGQTAPSHYRTCESLQLSHHIKLKSFSRRHLNLRIASEAAVHLTQGLRSAELKIGSAKHRSYNLTSTSTPSQTQPHLNRN